jgi:hypothetical protein
MSDFDAGFYIDIQPVCGASFERTKAFLRDSPEPEAEELLAYLESCAAAVAEDADALRSGLR